MDGRARVRAVLAKRQLVQPPLRLLARAALATGRVRDGVTVVTVNWNSAPYLREALRGIRRFSPPGTAVTVVDNASSDASVAVARDAGGVRVLRLPVNIGHWRALDIGFLLARTSVVVALDVDAFPVAEGWLDRLVAPLDEGYPVAGAHVRGGVVHPCCLAMRLDRFVSRRHTFAPLSALGPGAVPATGDPEVTAVDVGAAISLREGRPYLFERSEVAGPGDVGSVWDGLVYHNFYSTRFDSPKPLHQEEVWTGITPDAVSEVWGSAVARFLG